MIVGPDTMTETEAEDRAIRGCECFDAKRHAALIVFDIHAKNIIGEGSQKMGFKGPLCEGIHALVRAAASLVYAEEVETVTIKVDSTEQVRVQEKKGRLNCSRKEVREI